MMNDEFSYFNTLSAYLDFIEREIKESAYISASRFSELTSLGQKAINIAFIATDSPFNGLTIPKNHPIDLIMFKYDYSVSKWASSILFEKWESENA